VISVTVCCFLKAADLSLGTPCYNALMCSPDAQVAGIYLHWFGRKYVDEFNKGVLVIVFCFCSAGWSIHVTGQNAVYVSVGMLAVWHTS